MAQAGPDGSVIDLDIPGGEDQFRDGPRLPARLIRGPLIALLVLGCVFVPAASARSRPVLGDPMWSGSVSLNGFSLGPHNVYVWRLDGKAVIALDVNTGRPRWSRTITDVPQSIEDLGNGVVVVTTRSLPDEGVAAAPSTIMMLRDTTGALVAQTTGDNVQASADGRRLLVYSSRPRDLEGCSSWEIPCTDVTAWDVETGTVAWQVNLAPNTSYIPSTVDNRVDALAEIDADGTVRLRDVSSGAVTATMTLPPGVSPPFDQLALFHGVFLIAHRGPQGITVSAFGRPALRPIWSVVLPDSGPVNPQTGVGTLDLWQCGADACLSVYGVNNRVIDESTGAVTSPASLQIAERLGSGVFLATPLQPDPSARPSAQITGFIVDPAGHTLATIAVNSLPEWRESGDRALVTQEGTGRTGFVVIDSRGNLTYLGGVPGTALNCQARADTLACSDPSGTLRVWRMP